MSLPGKFPALLLNADMQPVSMFPLSVLPWHKSVKGIYEGTHTVVAEYDQELRSPSTTIKIPSVVALKQYHRPPKRVAFTRFNVFLRDRFRCQYCNGKFPSDQLTFDHVIPRDAGGQTTWDNITSACEPCNSRKSNGQHMRPIRWPKEPTPYELLAAKRGFPPGYLHETWVDFLYWDGELEE